MAKGQNNDLNALYLMTLNVTNKNPTWSLTTPACQWKGVTCNPFGSVAQIVWSGMSLGGTANFTALPQRLLSLYLGGNQLTGVPDLVMLPQGLQVFDLSFNDFIGNGSFTPRGSWCKDGNLDAMCGMTDGNFNCVSGVWSC